ncbi:terminase small subunit [Alteromonas mediterranea]|uniref:terminase small subunit n=1 Tax=Alteromonas mediterranea TaxID=314275 RepID=UPI00241D1B3B|nr:terminase small subunit [Alteromonas mediterranea]
MAGSKLSQKQEVFCISYAKHGNATRAYKEAYNAENMKPATIYVKACELLKNGKIEVRLKELNKMAVSDAVMTKQEALQLLSVKARIRITDVCDFKQEQVGNDEEGNPVFQTVWTMKNAEDIDPAVAACIKSVTVTKTGPKIELYDANASAKLLADMLGWNAPVESNVNSEVRVKNEWNIHPTQAVVRDDQQS